MTFTRRSLTAMALATACALGPMAAAPAMAASAQALAADGIHSLHKLEATDESSHFYERHAKAVLVFPSIIKAGLVFGGESGNGVLFVNGRAEGFYNLSGGTFGFQAGAEKFSYALFFMNNSALRYLHKSGGFAAGTGPSIAVINKGIGAEANSTTIVKDVYAMPFNESGLMADLTLQGTKISVIHPH